MKLKFLVFFIFSSLIFCEIKIEKIPMWERLGSNILVQIHSSEDMHLIGYWLAYTKIGDNYKFIPKFIYTDDDFLTNFSIPSLNTYFLNNYTLKDFYRLNKNEFLFFLDKDTLKINGTDTIISHSGTIIKSIDKGKTWQEIEIPKNTGLKKRKMINSNNGYVFIDSLALFTKDAWNTFTTFPIPDSLTKSYNFVQSYGELITLGFYMNNNIDTIRLYSINDSSKIETNVLYFDGKTTKPHPSSVYIFNNIYKGNVFLQYPMIDIGMQNNLDIYSINSITGNNKFIANYTSNFGSFFSKCSFYEKINWTLGGMYCLIRSYDQGDNWEMLIRHDSTAWVNSSSLVSADSNICYFIDNPYIYKVNFQSPTDVENEHKSEISDGIKISPNPASDYIDIKVPVGVQLAVPMQVEIYDIIGERIQTTPSTSLPPLHAERELKIDVSGFVPGVYFVKIGDRVQRFVKI